MVAAQNGLFKMRKVRITLDGETGKRRKSNMYAIIETGGKQYRVQEGDVITIEKLNAEVGEKVTFDKVLVMGEGADAKIGTPYVGENVYGEVVENGKGKKVIIYKYKAKKDYRKKQGHRQPFTKVEITGIGADKQPVKKAAAPAEEAPAEAPAAEAKESVSMSMKKDELIAFAEAHDIKVDAKATKQAIIDTINENL
jgi:large subunit ribosomal protein L21